MTLATIMLNIVQNNVWGNVTICTHARTHTAPRCMFKWPQNTVLCLKTIESCDSVHRFLSSFVTDLSGMGCAHRENRMGELRPAKGVHEQNFILKAGGFLHLFITYLEKKRTIFKKTCRVKASADIQQHSFIEVNGGKTRSQQRFLSAAVEYMCPCLHKWDSHFQPLLHERRFESEGGPMCFTIK